MTSHQHPGVGPGRPATRVLGPTVDHQTRCIHYAGPLDVIAIRFHCCGDFYPCFRCHADTAGHAMSVWPRAAFDTHALLCGVCKNTLSIADYQATDACPSCGTGFNPGCELHYPLYFES